MQIIGAGAVTIRRKNTLINSTKINSTTNNGTWNILLIEHFCHTYGRKSTFSSCLRLVGSINWLVVYVVTVYLKPHHGFTLLIVPLKIVPKVDHG